jgi:hypothetical protein
MLVLLGAAGALVYGVIEDPAVSSPIAGAVGVIIAAILQRRWEKRLSGGGGAGDWQPVLVLVGERREDGEAVDLRAVPGLVRL